MPKLSELGKILTGITPATSNTSYYDSFDIPFVKPSDIPECTIGSIIRAEHYIAESARSKAKIVPADSILVTCIGTIGKTAIARKECAFNQQINAIVPNKTLCNTEYLARAVWFEMQKARNIANAPVVPIINKTQFSNIYITLPPLKVQLKIAQTLSRVDALLALCEKFIIKLETLIKSRFIEMFNERDLSSQKQGWTKISSVGTVIGGATPSTSVPEYWDGDATWITPAELKDDRIYVNDSVRKLTKVGVESASLTLIPRDAVLLTSRAPIGKVAIAGCEMYCNQGFKNIVCGEQLVSRYLCELLRMNSDFLNSLGRGATFKEISKKIVEEISIPLPSVSSQLEYVRFVNQIDKLRFDIQRQIEKLETLKKSLMQEYFG